jgi:rare lipoprotein A
MKALEWMVVLIVVGWVGVFLVMLRGQLAWAGQAPAGQERGRASWYGESYRGKKMANGQIFDPEGMTCASFRWPLGSLLRVVHLASGRSVVVEVTDRGPAAWTGCMIDLSARAFRRLEDPGVGRIVVSCEYLGRAR